MGALTGIRIVEFGAIGPAPFCAMLLADMGAEVLRLDRTVPSGLGVEKQRRFDTTRRNRPSVALDLKKAGGRAAALRLTMGADALIEGFRPGVMERLGLGPETCLQHNPKLVYGRMTGWGQDGPLAQTVGHDINYLALSGILGLIGRKDRPPSIPLNLVGDYGGGALYLALGLVAALLEAQRSGKGQVVDAAMIDGILSLFTAGFGARAEGLWHDGRESNIIDGGAPWYDVYETKDGGFVSIAPIERKFFVTLLEILNLDPGWADRQFDRSCWPALRAELTTVFRQRDRDDWVAVMAGREVCFAPVLSLDEAMAHPHIRQRGGFVSIDGVPQPAPAPRFGRRGADAPTPPPAPGQDTATALRDWGFSEAEVRDLLADGSAALAAAPAEAP